MKWLQPDSVGTPGKPNSVSGRYFYSLLKEYIDQIWALFQLPSNLVQGQTK